MNKKPLIVGITGGIGSGKTTLANWLRSQEFLVYDSDKEARRLQNEHPEIKEKIIAEFGTDIYNGEELNRKKLAEIVFQDESRLRCLNQIIHPMVMKDAQDWIEKNSSCSVLFFESAILFESGFDKLTDKVVLVTASEEIRITRVVQRDGVPPETVKQRISKQLRDEEKLHKVDFIVRTDIDIPLETQMKEVLSNMVFYR